MWIDPIYDRTITDVEYARRNANSNEHLKGARDWFTLYRITNNMYFLADMLKEFGKSLILECKRDWKVTDIPTLSEIDLIRTDLQKVRDMYSFSDTPSVPNLPYNHFLKINDVEKIIFDFDTVIGNIRRSYVFSGEIYSGEVM